MGENIDDAAAAFLANLAPAQDATASKNKKKKKKKKKNTKNTEVNEVNEGVASTKANEIATEGVLNPATDAVTASKSKKKKKKGKKNEVSAMGKLAALHLQKKQEELAAVRAAEEEEKRLEEEEKAKEEAILKAEQDRKDKLKEERKRKKEELRKAGKPVTKAQRIKEARARAMREQLIAQGKIKVDENGNVIVNDKPKTKAKSKPKAKEKEEDKKVMEEVKVEVKKVVAEEKSEVSEKVIKEVKSDEPLVSNWEDLGGEDWETTVLQTKKSGFEDEQEVVVEEYIVQKSKPKKVTKETKGVEVKEEAEQSTVPATGLRSPICCVMGHVDTGKTKILDKLRKTNVQDNEAGGITQQIGATFFPIENLKKLTDKMNEKLSFDFKLPGLLMIDTPGHESFSNLRKRGSSLCDIAILIVDLMHGLEQQTIESLNLLREKKTPFIVCLNKIDRLYDWQPTKNASFRESLSKQKDGVILEFENRTKEVVTQLMQQGLNSKLYYENDDYKRVVSLVPTSAHTGEGMPDLLLLLIQLTQKMLFDKLTYKPKLECNVIEVKKIEGVGTTIDVILVNGELKEGDEIIVASLQGPVRTQIKALLTPQPLREMRIKSNYIHHKKIKAAMGVKIVAPGLETAIAGTQLIKYNSKKDKHKIKQLEQKVMKDYDTIIQSIDQSGSGVCVQASTLGSLEALIEFLKSSNIPINCVNLGPIHKKDVMRASVMLETRKEFATILAFDVKVTKDAQELSEDLGVKIFTAEIIYHLFDQFTKYMEETTNAKKELLSEVAVFPCVLRIMGENVFMKKSPLIMGVEVVEGILKVGTPIVVPDRFVADPLDPTKQIMLSLGKIESIEKDKKDVNIAKRGSKACVKITGNQNESFVQYGRHFDDTNLLYSKLSRQSIDSLKENFKDDLEKNDWMTVIKLKKLFDIQ